MKIFLILIFSVFIMAQSQSNCGKENVKNTNKIQMNNNSAKTAENKTMAEKTDDKTKYDNLPGNVKLTDEVKEEVRNEKGEIVSVNIITVEQALKKVGAKYEDGKLVDGTGTEIKFYSPPVRGMSQGYDLDMQQQEIDRKKLEELKAKYTVITLYIDARMVM